MAQPPRVLRAIARLNVGGPAQHVILLTAALRERYPTVLVAGSVDPHEADMAYFAAARGVEVTWIPELGRSIRPADDLVALWKLWRLCRRLKPAIVHTHTAKAGTLGRVAAWLAGVPVRVHTYHGHVFHGYFSPLKTRFFLSIERALARITTRIVAISQSQKADLQRFLGVPAEKIAVIPLGLDLERLVAGDPLAARQRFRVAIGARDEDVVVSIVGRFAPIKNQGLALRAAARVVPTDGRFLVALVGGGEEEARLRELVFGLGLDRHVRFAGWWSDLAAVYYGSDAVALTSDNEGTPVCLIEALACGCPVIATDVGGVRDVLQGGALGQLVPPGDVAALASAFLALIGQESRPRPREETAGLVRARYGVERLASDVAGLYAALMEGP